MFGCFLHALKCLDSNLTSFEELVSKLLLLILNKSWTAKSIKAFWWDEDFEFGEKQSGIQRKNKKKIGKINKQRNQQAMITLREMAVFNSLYGS